MKLQFLLIIVFMLTQTVYGQRNKSTDLPPRPPTKKEMDAEAKNHHCIKNNLISLTERLKKYPFNVAAQIQFVSFGAGVYLLDRQILKRDSLPRINDSILYSRLNEKKTITHFQIDQLTDLFYNYGYNGPIFTWSEAKCYIPKNAILFLDNSGKIIEIIEICFECSKMYASSENVSFGEMCDQKMAMLFDLFKKAGITYGITKGRLFGNER